MNTRSPAVQGRFYPSDPKSIASSISLLERSRKKTQLSDEKIRILGGVLPHAAHMYSGSHSIPLFHVLKKQGIQPDTFVIINPNHSGKGPGIALDPNDYWENSLGRVAIDYEFNSLLPFEKNAIAQKNEHSAEVLIPFIQYFYPENNWKILPVCMKEQTAIAARRLGSAILEASRQLEKEIVILASSDFSHFLSPLEGYEMDQKVLNMISKRDVEGVERKIRKHHISVCGYGPIMTLMAYCEGIDPDYETEILSRGHSGEIHPSEQVVDYISIVAYARS
jgi:AmmeMemoRadiSam system protein B